MIQAKFKRKVSKTVSTMEGDALVCMLKSSARNYMRAFGVFNLTRNLTAHLPRIIMYHGFCGPNEVTSRHLPAHIFRQQLEYITKYYRPIKLCDLVGARSNQGTYPRRAVVITIDDGYESFYRWAYPLLKEFGVPATVFAVTDLVDRRGWIWIDQVQYLCERAGNISELAKENQKVLFTMLRRLPVHERDSTISRLIEKASVSVPAEAPANYALMSWAQLQEIVESGLIEVGSHTRTHPIISYVNDRDLWEELYISRRKIEERLGVCVHSFCYPNGKSGDYREDQVAMVSRAGYRCATGSDFGYVTAQSNAFTLQRIPGNALDITLFMKALDGAEYLQRQMNRAVKAVIPPNSLREG